MKYKIGDNVKVLIQGSTHIGVVTVIDSTFHLDSLIVYEVSVGENVIAFLTQENLDELNDPGNLPKVYNDGDLVAEGKVLRHIDGYYLVETADGTRLAMTKAELDARNCFRG